jgi:hypothetical protein
VLDLWDKWSQSPENTTRGDETDIENFSKAHGIGERGKSQLRQHLWGQGGQLATGSRKEAWMGWGPAQPRRKPDVPGWEWDNHLLAYVSNAPRKFACDCGEELDMPGHHSCTKCGKLWNGYVIGTGGDNHEASVEKFLVREIPVRPDVIVAAKYEDPEDDPVVQRARERIYGDEEPPEPYVPDHPAEKDPRVQKARGKVFGSSRVEELEKDSESLPFPSDHTPKTPEIGATPDDWHSRSPRGQFVRNPAPRRRPRQQ